MRQQLSIVSRNRGTGTPYGCPRQQQLPCGAAWEITESIPLPAPASTAFRATGDRRLRPSSSIRPASRSTRPVMFMWRTRLTTAFAASTGQESSPLSPARVRTVTRVTEDWPPRPNSPHRAALPRTRPATSTWRLTIAFAASTRRESSRPSPGTASPCLS